ncbi:ubiquitin-related domain-containing protein [Roridomyces roridus]|uniref:Ubiquitin-related domain-containing protein n=1 Tax=Roridomyces roridus TaxID=1738132 RepID=A0AAD7FS28_9AGAR|nr:ubiquitin-related domain-containing protein [Roridomyces roridus]
MDQAEVAFLRTYTSTLASQAVTYPDTYQQPPENGLKKVPVLPIPVPPPPSSRKAATSSAALEPITLTFKSLKPPASYTITVHPTDTIAQVKTRLSEQEGGPSVDAQRLLLKGKAMADGKLLREYPIKDGDTVNLMLKAASAPAAVSTSLTPSSASVPPAPIVAPAPSRHQRIPSVVLSPSPSSEAFSAEKDITLTLDEPPRTPTPDLTSYHAAISRPDFWVRFLDFLDTEFPPPAHPANLSPARNPDAQTAFEDFLGVSKSKLSPGQIALIREKVGIMGMSGT